MANSREQQQIGALRTDDDRRAFLVRFWRTRNTAPGAVTTDARRAFYDRLPLVNERYRHGSTPGYRTDRGRVDLQYGPPAGIDRQSMNSDTAPFEVWTYENIAGNGLSEFVFVDRYNAGEMSPSSTRP